MRTGRGCYGEKPQNPSTLGQRIRAVRISWGWTLKQLGAAIHYSQKAVWHWEKGIQTPGDPALGAVADLFGLTNDALQTGVGFRVTDPPRQMGALLVAENYAADMVVLPPNDAEHLVCVDKDHRPVWVVVGPPVPRQAPGPAVGKPELFELERKVLPGIAQ
jgi:transcriptional regulator with XRE-family HTH domain